MKNNINNILIPQTKIPQPKKLKGEVGKQGQDINEFSNLLNEKIKETEPQGIKISLHAARRLGERDMLMDKEELNKIKDGLEKLKTKGGRDSLIVTPNGAYIVDVKNSTIVTAMDKGSIQDNVFTKIDSTLIVN